MVGMDLVLFSDPPIQHVGPLLTSETRQPGKSQQAGFIEASGLSPGDRGGAACVMDLRTTAAR